MNRIVQDVAYLYWFRHPAPEPATEARMLSHLSTNKVARYEQLGCRTGGWDYLCAHYLMDALRAPCRGKSSGSTLLNALDGDGPGTASHRFPQVGINLSHTRGASACIFASGCSCGVDVELIRPLPELEELAQCFLSFEEYACLARLKGAERYRLFLTYWTLKEAHLKAQGHGLIFPLNQMAARDGLTRQILFDAYGRERAKPPHIVCLTLDGQWQVAAVVDSSNGLIGNIYVREFTDCAHPPDA